MRRFLGGFLGVCLLWSVTANADELLIPDLKWSALEAGEFGPARFAAAEQANPFAKGSEAFWHYELGRLAFQSPAILGGLAAREGMSCNSCHQGGGDNAFFFVGGLSSERGTFDPTNALFSTQTDDQIHNPVRIPTLFGVAETAPYPSDGRFGTLEQMADHVIEKEFDGIAPPALVRSSLIAYLSALEGPKRDSKKAHTVSTEMEKVQRSLDALRWTLARQDADAAEFVANSMRRSLELLHNRFVDIGGAQSLIAAWSLELKRLRQRAEARSFDLAIAETDALKLKMRSDTKELVRLENKSLYDAERLATYIDSVFDR